MVFPVCSNELTSDVKTLSPRPYSSQRTGSTSFKSGLSAFSETKMAAGVEIRKDFIKLLEKRKLGHLVENFQREKVTVDVISKFLTLV